jgi:hypothetical protein
VQDNDVGTIIIGLLKDKRAIIRVQTLQFIFGRAYGRPKQDVSLSGGFVHIRDPFLLAALPQEALLEMACTYDKILAKHRTEDASQDTPQNQIESDTTIEAVRMEPALSSTHSDKEWLKLADGCVGEIRHTIERFKSGLTCDNLRRSERYIESQLECLVCLRMVLGYGDPYDFIAAFQRLAGDSVKLNHPTWISMRQSLITAVTANMRRCLSTRSSAWIFSNLLQAPG